MSPREGNSARTTRTPPFPIFQVVAHSAERRRAMPEAVGAKPAYLTNASVAQLAEATGPNPAHVQVQILPDAPFAAVAQMNSAGVL